MNTHWLSITRNKPNGEVSDLNSAASRELAVDYLKNLHQLSAEQGNQLYNRLYLKIKEFFIEVTCCECRDGKHEEEL